MTTVTYSKLFEPIKIGKVEIKNRIAMAPLGIGGLTSLEGGFSQRAIDYYVERAKGGAGLIITGLVKVDNEIERFPKPYLPDVTWNPHHFNHTASELTERVHAYGAKILLQLTLGFGRSMQASRMAESQCVAPSAIPNYWEPAITCRELATEEVERLVEKTGEAAVAAAMAGFDGVEIHAMHEGYLVDQFTIAMFNRRTDKYGGDLRGRLTFVTEMLHEIKSKVSQDFPVSLRFSIKSYVKDWSRGALPGEEFQEAGRDTEEGLRAAQILEEAGYDAFNADAGTYDAWYWAHPPHYQEHGLYLPLTEKLKDVVKVPVIVAGRMEIPDLAEKAITEGKADMVALGRGLLAEPYWANKVMEGRAKNIRPCLGCHDGCLGRILHGRPLSCAVNPACGRERTHTIQPAGEVKNVMVIGGGVAGMEAARVAAVRKHRVTLYEKSAQLGGHVIEGSVPSFKDDWARLLEWYKTELSELEVELNLGKEVSPELVLEKKPDVAIVATGSSPRIPDIPGIGKEKVTTATGVLLDEKKAGDSVVIMGGGLVGCETAVWLARQGKKVTIVEILGDLMQVGNPVPWPNELMLRDLLKFHEANVLTDVTVLEITDDGVVLIDKSFQKNTLLSDTVVLAVGLEPDQGLYRSLSGKIPNLYLIGDAREAQNVMYAIWDANEVARNI